VGASVAAQTAISTATTAAASAVSIARAETAFAAAAAATSHEHISDSSLSGKKRARTSSMSFDMSLDHIEEMLDAAAATATNNDESCVHACRHCVHRLYI
jgi:hypothetical protein